MLTKQLNIIVFLLISFSSYAQLEIYENEIEYLDGIAMYKNKQFTGTVYSDDVNLIPNACECTLKAHFKNGKRHGLYSTWNNDGSLQIEATYVFGKLNGDKKYYQNNELVRTESYNNDRLIKKIDLLSDNKKIITTYQSDTDKIEKVIENNIITEKKYKNNILVETNKYKDGFLLEKYIFEKPHNKTIIKYNDKGVKLSEYHYKNGELISGGKLVNGKREGEWVIYSDDMLVKKMITYKDGNAVKTTTIDARKFIKNNKPNQNSMIVTHTNVLNNNSSYYLIAFENYQANSDLKQKIAQLINKRTQVINDYSKYSEQEIDFLLTFKWLDNNKLSVIRTDFDGKIFEEYMIDISSSINSEIALLKAENLKSNNSISFNEIFSRYFPIHFYISGVRKQSETEVYYIDIDKGRKNGIIKKTYFVYDQDTHNVMSEVKPIKIYNNKAVCKVYSYQEWLKKYMKNHQEILIIEK